jgi:hypothetical protein
MKKLLLLKLSILFVTNSYAQTMSFTKPNPQPGLVEVYAGTFASGDIDGDGDKDLFMIGQTPATRTKLYLNDGTGNFTELAHSFPLSSSGQAFLKDLDNDGDLDLYYSGQTNSSATSRFTRIYRNNGSGVFTQVVNAGLPNILWRGAAIADVDNDGDQDIAMTGTGSGVSGVYLNNGNAVFTPQGNSVFAAVSGGIAFIDMENDGDQDVVISGGSSIKLYQNNGSGVFTLNTNSTFAPLSGTDIDVADTDNDGDLDFLVNGNTQNLLYRNNGSGIFTQIPTTFQQTDGGQNAIADLDNDGDQDVLIVGTQAGGLPHIYNIVYRNAGNNVFVPVDTLGGEYIADCVVDDFTGDGFKDIIIQGFSDKTNIYWNTSSSAPPLPLELISFTGKTSNENIVLNWTTRDEVNTDYFIIERSINGRSYSSDGTVRSTNNPSAIHNYQYQVKNSANGMNYFRLKMVDNDGTFSYSNIISIRTGGVSNFSILGNPVKDNLSVTGLEVGATLTLYDNVGKMILQKNIEDESLLMDVSFLSSGVYYLQYSNERLIENRKIVKQ